MKDALVTPRRAWIVGTSGPVAAIDVDGADLRVAALMPQAAIRRTVPVAQLRPVVLDETAVAPRAGAPADPALRVLPGFPLPVTTAPWIPVEANGALAFRGVVPAAVRGTIWTEVANSDGGETLRTFVVHAAPSDTAPVRAIIHAGARIRARGQAIAEWAPIIARGEHAVVEGFVDVRPPPPRSARGGSMDFGDEIEGELLSWLPVGTCLWDAPRGRRVGAVTGGVYERPAAAEPGWSAIVLDTPWGKTTYYANIDIVDPKPSDESWEQQPDWSGELGNPRR